MLTFLFLNKPDVSGGPDEVVREDVSGIKPQPAAWEEPLGPGPRKAEMEFVCLVLRERGAGARVPDKHVPSPRQPVPSVPLGSSGVGGTFK